MLKKISRNRRKRFFNRLRNLKRKHYNNSIMKKKFINLFMFFIFMYIPVYIFYKALPYEYSSLIDSFLLRTFLFLKSHAIIVWIKTILFLAWNFISDNVILFFSTLTIKKFALLSVIGLGKRFIIDHIIIKFLYQHFIKDIKEPIKDLFKFIYNNFKSLSIKRKFIGLLSLVLPASLVSYTLYSMNLLGFILEKVFSANMWKIILAFVLKGANTVFYFFSNYIWNSWIAPILEIFIFSFILGFLEKHISFIGKPLRYVYRKFEYVGNKFIYILDKFILHPSRKKMKKGAIRINKKIYNFIKINNKSSLTEIQKNKSYNMYLKIKKNNPELFKRRKK